MSRETYPLTDETLRVLSDHVGDIAREWEKHPSYLYQILSSVECDIFARFRGLYAACVRAGVSMIPWDVSLAEIRSRYNTEQIELEGTACLAEKITLDADTTAKMVDALRDGVIDAREAVKIRAAIARERDSLDVLETWLGMAMGAEAA